MTFADFCKDKDLREMAVAAGCHYATICNYKKGHAMPSDLLIRIADYYKVTTDRVLGHLVPKELVNDQAYPARPPVIHTVTTEQQDLAQHTKELEFKYESLQKEYNAQKLAHTTLREAYDETESISKTQFETITQLSDHINELKGKTKAGHLQAVEPVPRNFAELIRLKALLQSIHFLSEEK